MKIIQIMDNLNTGGGVNSFVYDLCVALKKNGVDVSLIGIIGTREQWQQQIEVMREYEIPVYCLCMKNKKHAIAKGIPLLHRLIKKIAGDDKTVCNLHLKLSVLMGGLATIGLRKVKCVETYHNTYHHYHLEFFMMQGRIHKYITVSETAKQEMYDRFHAPKEKVVAIPNGVDRNKLRSMVDVFGHGGQFLNIISVGRLSFEKNFIIPVKAFLPICNENIRYTLIGDGPQRSEIEEIARENSFINLIGAVQRQVVLEELAKADLIVMPSLWEGRSIIQLEAMAFDLPMIISDVPGLREPFRIDGINNSDGIYKQCDFGYLVETNNVLSYRLALEHFLQHQEDAIKMKTYISNISKELDIGFSVKKYIDVYNAVL